MLTRTVERPARPRRVYFVDALPTHPSAKVIKRELVAMAFRLVPG